MSDEGFEDEQPVTMTFSPAEAIVLFDLLYRTVDEGDDLTITLDYQAEQRVAWLIYGALQKHLVAPFKPNYVALLETARKIVQDPYDNRTGEDDTGDEVLPTR